MSERCETDKTPPAKANATDKFNSIARHNQRHCLFDNAATTNQAIFSAIFNSLLEIVAYVQVNLDQRSEVDTNAFVKSVKKAPWIVECVAISGTHDYLLKIAARNIDHFGELTMKNLLRFPGVTDVMSNLVLASIKDNYGNVMWPVK